ncbi:hypothetical protein [Christiangramia forsetii]|uniref:Uncharacterized protein n=2 Tax=Christiangramia forsetii TaxID=411153 RepID=A0M497_CHRFK|nr:hypothetical protein [Christiangramia forsetii]GGG23917.1 hypothetical protein GCM10011532_03920 [Christiangramia forsetii]CAL67442.1 hypothetical protein GFO_2486 [Christiangramia forsetii KT0803]
MAYKNQYRGRKVHSQSELEQICESQYETIRKLLMLVDDCKKGFEKVNDFDEDIEEVYDDPGHIAKIHLGIISRKLNSNN